MSEPNKRTALTKSEIERLSNEGLIISKLPKFYLCPGCGERHVPVYQRRVNANGKRISLTSRWCSQTCLLKYHPPYVDLDVIKRAKGKCEHCHRVCGSHEEAIRFMAAHPHRPDRGVKFGKWLRTIPTAECVKVDATNEKYCLESVKYLCQWCAFKAKKTTSSSQSSEEE